MGVVLKLEMGNLKLEMGHEVRLVRSDGSEATNLKLENKWEVILTDVT